MFSFAFVFGMTYNNIHQTKNKTHFSKCMTVVDMHSGGEPLRIVETGFPDLQGNLLAKRKYLESHDDFRKMLLSEPRGHFDMYGAVITEPDDNKEADVAVIFLHNDGMKSGDQYKPLVPCISLSLSL